MTKKEFEPDPAAQPSALPATRDEPPRPCLLLVDDDGTIREMLRISLDLHYRVICLPNGEGVIGAIEEFHPRLLVLDINLPGADGYEICEKVRAEARFRRLPILFTTVRTDDATFLKGLQIGGNSLILKPFEISAFRERVEYLLKANPRA